MAMWEYAIKAAVSAVVVVAVSELAKRDSLLAAGLASLPLTSLLAIVWLYVDTGDTMRVVDLSRGIAWLVAPSVVLFLVLPVLLRAGWSFWASLAAASAATAASYAAVAWALGRLGLRA